MFRRLFALAALSALLVQAAHAHVVFAEPEAAAGAYYAGFLRISHGCGTSPTRSVRVQIPEGVNVARPQPKAGWTLHIERTPLALPAGSEMGDPITERVTSITWTGELPADQFDEFGVMMRLPDRAGPLYFPVVQTCAAGQQVWDHIPGAPAGSVEHPAPMLMLAAPRPHDGHAH
jgi:periplasmic copper chaperone A